MNDLIFLKNYSRANMITDLASIKSISSPSDQDNAISSLIEEENQFIDAQLKSAQETEFSQDMENKLQRLKAFIQSLDLAKDTQISRELLEHFQKEPDEFIQIDSNYIVKETVKRIEKMKKAKKIKKNWSSNDMKVLIWIICKYAQQQSINLAQVQSRDEFWKFISSIIPGTSPQSCLFKWLSERRYKITLHSWKEDEEKLLMQLQRKYSIVKNKWKVISEKLYLANKDNQKIFRHPKQCRQHYASFLDPNIIKGPWSKAEDNTLLTYIFLHNGEKKWCKLTKILEGRTQNAIKNRYQLLFSKLKKKKENKSKSEYEIIQEYLKDNDPQFQIKKQRAQAVKNVQQQKISVIKVESSTLQTIKSAQSMPVIPSVEQVTLHSGPRFVTPIVLNYRSNFRPFSITEGPATQKNVSFLNLCESAIKIEGKEQEK